jgi:UDP-4-amino-4,6-dideoxy-N-acetyl-beta-L-altrosamine N-acetyltransferase
MKYTKFQDLSLEEKKEVLEWRNHPEIRKWMLNKEKINFDEHLKFIENLEKSDKIYIKVGDFGVVNFTLKNGYVEFGLHKNPAKKGVGRKLMEFGINYAFDKLKVSKIILYVYENNKKAVNLYKRFGFKQTDKKDNLIKMELSYENRKNRH